MPDAESLAAQITAAVLDDLEGRKGFDWWWHDIDEDIQQEVRVELTEVVRRHLDG